MGCGESKQKARDGEGNDGPPENTVDSSSNNKVPVSEEVPEVKDAANEGVVDPLEEIRTANLEKFVGEFLFTAGKFVSLDNRQDEFQEKYNQERKDFFTFLKSVRDALQLSDVSIPQMGNLGTTLEKYPDKFQGLLVELSTLDVELQSVSDFRFKGLDRRKVGMFDMPEELRDELEDLATEAIKLLGRSRTIRFGILEMLREVHTAKWYITLNMIKANQTGHLQLAKNKLEKEVGKLRNEKEEVVEENDSCKAANEELKNANVELRKENQNLKECNQVLIQEKMSLAKENQQLKATMLDIMLKMEADNHPTYPKEPDLRPEPPEDDDPAVPSDRHEPDLLPEPRPEMGHYQPVISSGEALTGKSSLMTRTSMEKHTNVVPSGDSTGGGVQAPSKLDHDGQLPKPISDVQPQPPLDVKCAGSSGVKVLDEMVSVVRLGNSVGSDIEGSKGAASDSGVSKTSKVPPTQVGISKELADAVLASMERISRIGNAKTKTPNSKLRKSRMPSPSFPSSDLGILKVLSAISKEQEEIAAEDRAYHVRISKAQDSQVRKPEIRAKKDREPDAKSDQKAVKNYNRVQDHHVPDAKRSQVPVPDVQDADEIPPQNVPRATRRRKKKKQAPGLFKTLFKGFICTRRSAHD